jgi:CheY-like chemotaxis protein
MELRLVRLNDLIFDLYKLLRRLIGEDIELIILPSYNEAWVKVDPGQIEQVLVNLAINARDAMPEGGKLTIEITHCSFDAELARRYVGASAGDYIVLTVSDSGVGMNDHVKAHLFEPFFTTKEKGRGTGLGLATCYGIIKQHSGLIDVASIVGAGTTISIFLPQARIDGAMVRSIIDETRGLPRGSETILLVEDEPAVRVLAARVLRAQGYIVLEAENGDEALSIAQQRGRAIMHLLLTDVVMPRMSGKMLAERMTALLPDLKVLFTSGYANDTIISQGSQPGIAFLQKPFTPATLARKVRDVLDH